MFVRLLFSADISNKMQVVFLIFPIGDFGGFDAASFQFFRDYSAMAFFGFGTNAKKYKIRVKTEKRFESEI